MKTETNSKLTKDNRQIYNIGDSNHGFKIGDVINCNVLTLINNDLKKECKDLIKTYCIWNEDKNYVDSNLTREMNLI